MLNIKWIRENKELFDEKLSQRFIEPMSSKIAMLDGEKRKITSLIQELQHARKVKSKILGNMASKSGEEFEGLQRDVKHINEKLEALEHDLNNNNELNELLNVPQSPTLHPLFSPVLREPIQIPLPVFPCRPSYGRERCGQ